jgi:hypothetical protein
MREIDTLFDESNAGSETFAYVDAFEEGKTTFDDFDSFVHAVTAAHKARLEEAKRARERIEDSVMPQLLIAGISADGRVAGV